MKASTIAIDLAKNVFQVLGMDKHAKQVFSQRLNRAQLSEFMSQQPVCDVVFEACYSSIIGDVSFLPWGTALSSSPLCTLPPLSAAARTIKMMPWQFMKPALGPIFASCQLKPKHNKKY
ncbi:hypothetical protein DIKCMJMK_03528 [Shewanella oneidensis]|nr:hypothetical protein [Shewanella oneidensis]